MKHVVLLVTLFWASSLVAEEALLVSGDFIEMNAPKQQRTISNNVVVEQDTLRLEGDNLIQSLKKKETVMVVVDGSPATFRGIIEGDAGYTRGTADKLEYIPNDKTLKLTNFSVTDEDGNTQKGKSGSYIFQ